MVTGRHGLLSFLVHPDYIDEPRAQTVYECLLAQLAETRSRENLWVALPRDVAAWWRQRSRMRLVRHGRKWEVAGLGKERARIAYATLQDDRVVYELHSRPSALPRERRAA